MGLLRLSIKTYTWPRRVALGPVAAKPVFPTCGIIAGSSYAMSELKATMAGPLLFLRSVCPDTRWSMFVDDIASAVDQEDETQAVRDFVDSGVALRVALGDIGLMLEPAKSNLLSNKPSVLRKVRRLYGVDVSVVQATVTRLGIDHHGGNPRAEGVTPTALGRVRKALKRSRRLCGLMRSLGSYDRKRVARRLHMGAVVGVATHGSEVTAMGDAHRRALLTSQLRAMGIFGQGMSADYACALMGTRNVDHNILIAPALRYAREWWLATHPTIKPDADVLTPSELSNAYECEVARYRNWGPHHEWVREDPPRVSGALCSGEGPVEPMFCQ